MKVTISAAMRARDVSRPRSEQLAEAEASEATWEGGHWEGGSDSRVDGPRTDGTLADALQAEGAAPVADPAAGIGSWDRPEGQGGRGYHPRRRRRGSGGSGRPGGSAG